MPDLLVVTSGPAPVGRWKPQGTASARVLIAGSHQCEVTVEPERTVAQPVPYLPPLQTPAALSTLEFGWSTNPRTSGLFGVGVRGTAAGVAFTVHHPGIGIRPATRRGSLVKIELDAAPAVNTVPTQRSWFWQKYGVIAAAGTAHALHRADGQIIAMARGGRQLMMDPSMSPVEAAVAVLTFASGLSQQAAQPGLSSLLWF
jgi:hypothetical protein